MHSKSLRQQAMALLDSGWSLNAASKYLGVSRAALRDWRDNGILARGRPGLCFVCNGHACADSAAYAALLGYYLGDGCVSRQGRTYSLRVSCDETLSGIVADVGRAIAAVLPNARVGRVRAPGVVVVQCYWNHWPCLFPQHGPGRKHERALTLEDWQRLIVTAHPADFLRGLMHSDGCRVNNWATRTVAGVKKRYDYPRWQFVNHSSDIRAWCCDALDLLEIPWRRSSWKTVSVSTREGVARLDDLIGPKH
jgi:hypothetical protein